MRMIVTGGSGFIGTNLVAYFLEHGWNVLNFDIASPRNTEHLRYWQEVNLLDRDRLISETKTFQPSTFLHFGARTDLNEQHDLNGYAANIDGVRNVIEAIRLTPSIEQVIFASSQLVCKIGYSPKHDDDFCPSTLYGESKVHTEKIIKHAGDFGPSWTILRPTSLWGPWFDVPYKNFFTAIARNLYIHPGSVKTLKQWGFIGNSVYQIWKILQAPAEKIHRKVLYLADYTPLILREFADKIQSRVGSNPIRTAPTGLLKSAAYVGDFSQRLGWKNPPLTTFRYHNIVTPEVQDLTELEQIAGPLPFTVDHGIDITIRWLQDHQN